MSEPSLLRVGLFEIDTPAGTLRKSGMQVKLRQQPFLVLSLLASRPGVVVTREELRAEVWGGDTFVDFDQGLNYCIKEIRAALGDSAETPLYVETLPRRGYRFIAPVEVVGGTNGASTLDMPVATTEAPQPRLAWIRQMPLALSLIALGSALWVMTRTPPEPQEWRRTTFRRGSLSAARFAPGGDVVYTAAWDGFPPGLYVSTPGAPDARSLPVTGARLVSVSTSGELSFILTRASAQPVLARTPLAGGPTKEILDSVFEADATADGNTFAVTHLVPGKGILVEYPIGTVIAQGNGPTHLRISPDGSRLAFIEHPWANDDRGYVMVLARDGKPLAHSAPYPSLEGLAWAPSGDRVFFTAARVGVSSALRSLDLRGRERVMLPASGRIVLHDVARDGRMLIERCTLRSEVVVLAPDGTQRDLSWFDASKGTALSADGSKLLMIESGDAGGADYGVYLRATDGSPPVRLGSGSGTSLSPDGRLATSIPLAEPDHIDLLPIGAGEVRKLRHAGIVRYEWATFTPDGQGLVFVGGEPNRNMRVFVGDLVGGKPHPITPEGLTLGRNTLSPDGLTLVGPCKPVTFCLYSLDGTDVHPIPNFAGSLPVGWDDSGHSLIVRPRAQRWPISLTTLDPTTGTRTPWREVAPQDAVGITSVEVLLSRDGRTLVLNEGRRLSELYVAPAFD